jgi:hypothetical protein
MWLISKNGYGIISVTITLFWWRKIYIHIIVITIFHMTYSEILTPFRQGWRCSERLVIQYRCATYCTLSSITSSSTESDLGWPTLGLTIRVNGSGSGQHDWPDYINRYNTNPTRLVIGSKPVTRTRPSYDSGYSTRTWGTHLVAHPDSHMLWGRAAARPESPSLQLQWPEERKR